MKWFKHDTDASDDIKIKRLEEEYGNDGYAIFFKTLEIVGKEGKKGRISLEMYPKKWISNRCHISEERLIDIYEFMGRLSLICHKSLKKGEIRIPNFLRRSDDYTKFLRRKNEGTSKNVVLDKNRVEKNKNIYTHFQSLHKKETGLPYPAEFGKDKKIIYKLMDTYSEDELKELITAFFNAAHDPKVWWADKLSVGVFSTVIPQVIGGLRKK